MTSDDPRVPEYDPEADGLPDMIDPDSGAFDEDESVRESDGPESGLWPDDHPVALDRYGTTAREAREGAPLDERLAAEEPDVGADDPGPVTGVATVDPADRDEFDDPVDDGADDPDLLPDPYAEDAAADAETDEAELELDGPPDPDGGGAVGRLAAPEDDPSGGRNIRIYAEDEGMAGGGLVAEEQAMHVADDEDEPSGADGV
jgi:hypothetical protein